MKAQKQQHNPKVNKNKPVDHTNDKEMVAESLRVSPRGPKYDMSKTPSEQSALKKVKNAYNAQMRVAFGNSWSKKRAHRNETGMINVPMTRKDDGTFRISNAKH